ncbi:hypothetical protein MRX96_002049 [Rhipicephalus microplus]
MGDVRCDLNDSAKETKLRFLARQRAKMTAQQSPALGHAVAFPRTTIGGFPVVSGVFNCASGDGSRKGETPIGAGTVCVFQRVVRRQGVEAGNYYVILEVVSRDA